jgi:uncharacterized repeat protein (TIGR02059 family)
MLQSYGINHLGVNTLGLPGSGIITPIQLDSPTNLSVEFLSSTKAKLTWDDNSDNEDGFSILRTSVSGGQSGWSEVGTVGEGIEEFEDTTCVAETFYYYKICMYVGSLKSDYSNIVYGWSHTNILTHNSIKQIIIGNAETDIGIVINYSAIRGALKQVGEIEILIAYQDYVFATPSTIWNFDDLGLTFTADVSGTNIRLQAIVDNSSANDVTINYNIDIISGTKIISPVPNAVPNNLTVSTISASELDIAFQINSTNHDGHYLERSATGIGGWSVYHTFTGSDNTLQDTGLNDSAKWFYRVRAYKGTRYSDYSDIVAGETWLIVTSGEIRGTAPKVIMLTFDIGINSIYKPAISDFQVLVNGIEKFVAIVNIDDTTVVSLTLSDRVSVNDVITVTYTEPASNWMRSEFGTKVITFITFAITNNVADIAPTSVYDGNTLTWIDHTRDDLFTKDSNLFVSEYRDKLGSARKLSSAIGSGTQYCSIKLGGGLFFPGNYSYAQGTFTFVQPGYIYLVVQALSWAEGTILVDGSGNLRMVISRCTTVSPAALHNGGVWSGSDPNLTLNVWHIVRALFSGAASKLSLMTLLLFLVVGAQQLLME